MSEMPCYTPPPTEEETMRYHAYKFRHNSDIAEMLCTLLRSYVPKDVQLPKEIEHWWNDYQARDKKKEETEAYAKEYQKLKDNALSKLSDEDKMILKIKDC